jgi:glycerate kinase
VGGDLVAATVTGPHHERVPGAVLCRDGQAWVESAQACGLALTGGERAEAATTWGVGELLIQAIEAGATDIVVGLGGSGTNDGGAGLLGALGAVADRPLDGGVAGLDGIATVDLSVPRARLEGVTVTCASDVDSPLTGLFGATRTFGPQKGIPEERLPAADRVLEQLAAATDRRTSLAKGAGAAGGLGFALLLLGATRRPGFDVVADAVDLPARTRAADLVLTGEGAFDFSSRSGKVPYGVASVAAEALRPCVALAGRVLVGAREMRALGIESAYSLVDLVGEERALGDPAGSLAQLAERVARTWSR